MTSYRERCEELEEEIRQLKAELYGTWEAPKELGLTAAQERIVGCLLQHDRTVTVWCLFGASRTPQSVSDDVDGSNVIQVTVSHIRAKIRPFGLDIENVWGRGYRLSADTRFRLLNWNTTSSVAA